MMKYALPLAALVFGLVAPVAHCGSSPTPTPRVELPEAVAGPYARSRIIAAATALIGTTERTGNNDGPAIDRILAAVGLSGSGAPWCAAANRYIYDQAGLHTFGPRSAWAPDWVRSPTWTQKAGGTTPLPGDIWGIYFSSKGRVAHTGIVRAWGDKVVVTLEGNTSPDATAGSAADRDGGGYWSKRRLKSQIYSVRAWVK